jgi:putative addiction module CopG family antidote
MTVSLPVEFEGYVQDKVRNGAFTSEEEVVRAALELMREQDEESPEWREWMREAVEEGWVSAQAGRLTSAEDFEKEFEEHKRRWRAAHANLPG